jgi:hypothetical protein
MTIKMHLSRSLVAFFLLNAGFVFAGGFKSNIVTTSQLTITVPEDRFLKITNFTQEGGTDRGVVSVTLSGNAGGTANVLTATRIDFSTGINSQNFPEIGNAVFIAGPAEVTVPSVAGATLLITYKKERNEDGFKSKIITTSQFTITVPEDRFLKITNFTQEGGTDRGVVSVPLNGAAGGTANVLTATRIDFSTGINSQNFPEIGTPPVIIAGPTEAKVPPVPGATLLITYKKGPNEGGEETTPIVTVSPTPGGTPTPSATPTITPTVTPTPTSSPTPTAFPTITPRPTLGPLK